jgi:hypothetical protein
MPTPPAQLPSIVGPRPAVRRSQARNRRAEHVVLVAVAVTGALGLAAWQVPPLLDWSRYRSAIAVYASARLGRHVTIGGQVRLTVLPRAMLMADDVTLADRGDGISAKIGTLRLEISLGSLLAGRVLPRALTMDKPVISLPWPLPRGTAPGMRPALGQEFSATMEDGTVLLGGAVLRTVSASFRADPDTGAFGAQGSVTVAGLPWRFTALVGAPGGDGVSPLTLTLDGQAPYGKSPAPSMQGTGGSFHGRILREGSVAGRLALRGPDLSRFGPAPALAWQIAGQVQGDAVELSAPSLDLVAGTSPGHAAVKLRLAAPASFSVTASVGTFPGGGWIWPLLRANADHAQHFAASLDLSAGAVVLAGETLRAPHVAWSLTTKGAEFRDVSAILPGGATWEAKGTLDALHGFSGHAHLVAPSLRRTLHWVSGGALDGLPPAVLGRADVQGDLIASPSRAVFTIASGQLDESVIGGTLAVGFGTRPAIGLDLTLDRVNSATWIAPHQAWVAPGLDAAARMFSAFDANIRLRADSVALPGLLLRHAALDADSGRQGLQLHHFTADLPGGHVAAAGNIGGDGMLAGASIDLTAPDAALLPESWRVPAKLWQGPFHLAVDAAGPPQDVTTQVRADLGDLRAEAEARVDATVPRMTATVTLRHPGAPRLLDAIGVHGAESWLDNGSLAVLAHLVVWPGHVQAKGFSVSAAALQLAGDFDADWTGSVPVINGNAEAGMLTLPALPGRSETPLPWSLLDRVQGEWHLRAAHVVSAARPVADNASATLIAGGGVGVIDDLQADFGGGRLAGQVVLDATQDPPALAARLTGAAFVPDDIGPVGLTLNGGAVDVAAQAMARGYSAMALLAAAAGEVTCAMRGVSLRGLDLGAAAALLTAKAPGLRQALRSALASGATGGLDGRIDGSIADGVLTINGGRLAGGPGAIALTGQIDLTRPMVDLALASLPAVPSPPALDVRLVGDWASPRRLVDSEPGLAWAGQGRGVAPHPVHRRR